VSGVSGPRLSAGDTAVARRLRLTALSFGPAGVRGSLSRRLQAQRWPGQGRETEKSAHRESDDVTPRIPEREFVEFQAIGLFAGDAAVPDAGALRRLALRGTNRARQQEIGRPGTRYAAGPPASGRNGPGCSGAESQVCGLATDIS
jgi:hypothetical protein